MVQVVAVHVVLQVELQRAHEGLDSLVERHLRKFIVNLLDLAKRGDFYDDIVDPLFAPGGVFEVR